MSYFNHPTHACDRLKQKDKKLAWAIEQIGDTKRSVILALFSAVINTVIGQKESKNSILMLYDEILPLILSYKSFC